MGYIEGSIGDSTNGGGFIWRELGTQWNSETSFESHFWTGFKLEQRATQPGYNRVVHLHISLCV